MQATTKLRRLGKCPSHFYVTNSSPIMLFFNEIVLLLFTTMYISSPTVQMKMLSHTPRQQKYKEVATKGKIWEKYPSHFYMTKSWALVYIFFKLNITLWSCPITIFPSIAQSGWCCYGVLVVNSKREQPPKGECEKKLLHISYTETSSEIFFISMKLFYSDPHKCPYLHPYLYWEKLS